MLVTHARQKLGRNAQCPCGSGKKYKYCCLHEAEVQRNDSPWHKQHEASDRLSSEMLRFVRSEFSGHSQEVWKDYNQELLSQDMDKFPGEDQVFIPYFLFDWDPERPASTRRKRRYPGMVAQAFMEKRGRKLGELESAILLLSIYTPLSFYEVLSCEPGFGMRIRDVLIGGDNEVEEHTGSRTVQVGDIVYAQLCRLPDVTVFSRLAPTVLRPGRKAELVRLRAWMRQKTSRQGRELGEEDLIRFEDKIRAEYLNARDAMHVPPKLCNTDGEPILLHTLRYRIASAQVTFDALAPLAWGKTKEELLETAEVDADGTMRNAEIEWLKAGNAMHKSWGNTILGHMKIEGRALTVDVNSANRARKIRDEIEKRLGMMAVHENTSTRTQEEMMQSAQRRRLKHPGGDDNPQVSAPSLEEQAALEMMLREHAEAWVDTKIPALGGRTPREALADSDGREAVEGLILEWERQKSNSSEAALRNFDAGTLRRLLGL